MNKLRRKQLDRSFILINEAMGIIQQVMDDEQTAYDNLPESFQNGERGEQMSGNIESLEEAICYLEDAKSVMEDIYSRMLLSLGMFYCVALCVILFITWRASRNKVTLAGVLDGRRNHFEKWMIYDTINRRRCICKAGERVGRK